MSCCSVRRGISVIEVVVVISIIGLLLALILPAVMASRRTARRTECLNNTRQIALAMNEYAATHDVFPTAGITQAASYLVKILPHIDELNLYEKFDFNANVAQQLPLAEDRPFYFACPSDPIGNSHLRAANYFANMGWGNRRGSTGVIYNRHIRPENIADGISNTALISEFLPTHPNDPRRATWAESFSGSIYRPVSQIASDCLSANNSVAWPRGTLWTLGAYGNTTYDHALPPNTRSCMFTVNASSLHENGVNTAFCDGSVRYINDSIDGTVWQAIGTRAGGEAVDSY